MTNYLQRLMAPLFLLSMAIMSCNKEGTENYASDEEPWIQHEKVEQTVKVTLPETRLTLDETQMKRITPTNDFSFSYFRDVYDSDKDILISPLGFQAIISMIVNQSKDNEALFERIGFKGEDLAVINDYFRCLIGDLNGERCGKELKFANALISDVGAKKYTETYIKDLSKYYLADYLEIEAKPLSAQPIGSRPEDLWVLKNTGGMMESAPFPIEPGESTMINAICFKGEWTDKFDKELTRLGSFYVNQERSINMPMMNKRDKISYFKNNDLSAVSLPFGDGTYNLTVILPVTTFDIPGILEKINSEDWDKIRTGFETKDVALMLPVFSMSCPNMMQLEHYDTNSEIVVKIIAQKVSFMMDEEGAAAAAVTQSKDPISPSPSSEPKYEVFSANVPFLYTISESGSGLILFIGVFSGGS